VTRSAGTSGTNSETGIRGGEMETLFYEAEGERTQGDGDI